MSINGVRQLRRLTIGYCDYSGASRGVRQFIRTQLIDLAKKHPEVEFHARLRRRVGPALSGIWLNKFSQQTPLANLDANQVRDRIQRCLDKCGRKSMLLWPTPRTQRTSLQGQWSPLLNYTKPVERIYPPDYISSQVKKMTEPTEDEILKFEQEKLDEGVSPIKLKKLLMTPEQRHRMKAEDKFYSGIDNIIKLRERHGINPIAPPEIQNDPEKLAAFEKDVSEKIKSLQVKLKEDAKDAKKEKTLIKRQLRKEKMYQSWRDNIVIKAKYPFASVRPSILYGEWPPKNPDGTIHRGPLDFALRPNEKFLEHFPHRAADAILDSATGKPYAVAEQSLKRSASDPQRPAIRNVPVEIPALTKEQSDKTIPYFIKKQWLNDTAKALAEKREAVYAQRAQSAVEKSAANSSHNGENSSKKTNNKKNEKASK